MWPCHGYVVADFCDRESHCSDAVAAMTATTRLRPLGCKHVVQLVGLGGDGVLGTNYGKWQWQYTFLFLNYIHCVCLKFFMGMLGYKLQERYVWMD